MRLGRALRCTSSLTAMYTAGSGSYAGCSGANQSFDRPIMFHRQASDRGCTTQRCVRKLRPGLMATPTGTLAGERLHQEEKLRSLASEKSRLQAELAKASAEMGLLEAKNEDTQSKLRTVRTERWENSASIRLTDGLAGGYSFLIRLGGSCCRWPQRPGAKVCRYQLRRSVGPTRTRRAAGA